MPDPIISRSKKGLPMHYSVGAIIKNIDNKYLLIDRAKPPFGFACVAGHIDVGETKEQALIREVKEESGLTVTDFELLYEEELDFNTCRRGITVHNFSVFECQTKGEINQNILESKSIGWYDKDEIRKLILEPVWEYWFSKIGILERK